MSNRDVRDDYFADAEVPRFLESAILMMKHYDLPTYKHLLQVGASSSRLATLLDVKPREADAIRWAGLLHDFGKIGISRHILNAPRPLTMQEWELIKLHPESGASFVRLRGEIGLADVISAHHERIDGRGYPWGLSGSRIPYAARIIAVADAYDVLTHGRPYREALSPHEAYDRILEASGTQFDPECVDALANDIANTIDHSHSKAM
jgi:HD-GYP domain-containing protein (c-di-GMP phosphodiesterase class II)